MLSGNPRKELRTRRGGEESYHAPEGNPHAADVPHGAEGFVSVVSEPSADARGRDRRRREPHFRETDPYDLSGRRSRDPKKRVARKKADTAEAPAAPAAEEAPKKRTTRKKVDTVEAPVAPAAEEAPKKRAIRKKAETPAE